MVTKFKKGDKVFGKCSGEIVELKEIVYPLGNYTLAKVKNKETGLISGWTNTIYLNKLK